MTNSDIADILKAYADLSELHGENPFKIKSFTSASFRIDKLIEPLFGKTLQELENTEGIGKSIAQKLVQIFETNTFPELTQLIESTPAGVRQIMRIKGIGPKKVSIIWKEMQIESIGELLYACKENRLAQYKGFGLKTQEAIIKQIEFMFASAGQFHYAKIYPIANELMQQLQQLESVEKISFTGEFYRKMETLSCVEILVGTSDALFFAEEFESFFEFPYSEETFQIEAFSFKIRVCKTPEFAYQLFQFGSNQNHAAKVLERIGSDRKNFESELEIYQAANMAFVHPEMREDRGEIVRAIENTLPNLITYSDLKGPLHNHSTYSDGLHSIETMADYCVKQGYEYLGMADHSKSAFYANGLSEERVMQQLSEIAQLNQKYAGTFKIFTGIESDILYDGNLDYANDLLKAFDYVVASVHSILKMNEEKAMSRLIKAIENPYTTILGHPTGRLLLMREGYPINHHKIIDACAANGVIMELNANPYRLDMDWRYIDYALNKGVMISINPDAHEVEGFYDMFFGVAVARKGGLMKEMCFNAQSVSYLETHFKKRKV
ncbi:MAG: PHP domain-containing protein [Sphingobacteriales bacterium]|nr:PHP domain-containing protein [Sphingobacteriales bacterium]